MRLPLALLVGLSLVSRVSAAEAFEDRFVWIFGWGLGVDKDVTQICKVMWSAGEGRLMVDHAEDETQKEAEVARDRYAWSKLGYFDIDQCFKRKNAGRYEVEVKVSALKNTHRRHFDPIVLGVVKLTVELGDADE